MFTSAVGCLDVAFTHYIQAPPQPLLDAHPSIRTVRIDLRSSNGFEAISASFSQGLMFTTSLASPMPLYTVQTYQSQRTYQSPRHGYYRSG